MSPRSAQRGAALIALLVILSLGGAWFIVSRLNEASADFTVANRQRNAAALAEAKQALIGYVAMKAAQTSEPQPGALPCPENAADAGGTNEGTAAASLTLPTVGRLPWKTLGIDKLVDAAGEPLWYAVANGWGNCAATQTVINSNCTSSTGMACNTGQLTVDGRAKAAVALIIAPGRAMNVQAATGCTARNQLDSTSGRKAPASGIDPANYVECYSGSSFSTSGGSTSFNDQVLIVTAEELLPPIEAAVADRFERQIAPQFRSAYSGGIWPAAPLLPFAQPFGDPAASTYDNVATTAAAGLLPLSYAYTGPCTCASPPCTCSMSACATGGRCQPGFVTWSTTSTVTRTAGANLHSYSCSVAGTPSTLTCTLNVYMNAADWLLALLNLNSMTFNLDAVASNAGRALRKVNLPTSGMAPAIGGIDTTYANSPIGYTISSATMGTDGAATVRINARVPGGGGSVLGALGALTCSVFGIPLCYRHTISVPMLFADHPLVDPSDTTYQWFVRNKWHEASYYAVSSGIVPSGARSCVDAGTVTCLEAAYHTDKSGNADATKLRGLLVFTGRSLDGAARPNATLADWLEGANADGASPFAVRDGSLFFNRPSGFNDRIAVIDSN